MMDKKEQIKQLKRQIEILKQEFKEKEAALNELLDMLYKYSTESDETI